MTTATLPTQKFDILKQYANEFVISIDKDFWNEVYWSYLENHEMEQNKEKLVQRYEESLSSWYGMKI